jgi:Recombinase zinc beta ribbon domain/Resolvase, N terminal domain
MNDKPGPGDRIAYFGRVSTPKQKLEHHWEQAEHWLNRNDLTVDPSRRFEDKIRRHESASFFRDWDQRRLKADRRRYRFDELMTLVEARKLDWILISSFDRWGIKEPDDIFVFRSRLRDYGVQLYSCMDELNITGIDDSSFFRVAAAAIGSTKYVSQQAEKNIAKMVSMAEGGWATTGNAPFGLDLVLYNLNDICRPLWRVVRTRFKPAEYRIVCYAKGSRVERNDQGIITASHIEVESESHQQGMPPRDKKTTGYRYEPSVEAGRMEAVNRMFELFLAEMTHGAISDALWKLGMGHYGKPFGYHGVECILGNATAYTGRLAWGKLGVGEYRICLDKSPSRLQRKKGESLVIKKAEEHFVYPKNPLFLPLVPVDLCERVLEKLKKRPHVNESFGKLRTRDRTCHPLNGKLFCPDCNRPMVLGGTMPGKKTLAKRKKAKRGYCFVCGSYRKSIRTQCHPNTVSFELLEMATNELLQAVADRIQVVQSGDTDVLTEAEWLKKTELGRQMVAVMDQWVEGSDRYNDIHKKTMKVVFSDVISDLVRSPENDVAELYETYTPCFEEYDRKYEATVAELRVELASLQEKLEAITDLMLSQRKSPTIMQKLEGDAARLEARKKEIEPQLSPMTAKVRATLVQLENIRQTISAADKLKTAQLLDSFVERVVPIFDVQQVGPNKTRRTKVVGFSFHPRESARHVLSEVMKIEFAHTDRDSSTRPGGNWPGRWSRPAPAIS